MAAIAAIGMAGLPSEWQPLLQSRVQPTSQMRTRWNRKCVQFGKPTQDSLRCHFNHLEHYSILLRLRDHVEVQPGNRIFAFTLSMLSLASTANGVLQMILERQARVNLKVFRNRAGAIFSSDDHVDHLL